MAFSSAERQQRYTQKYPGRGAENVRRLATRKRKHVFDHKASKGCGVCGETDPIVLELHHRDPTQKTNNSSVRAATNWIRLKWSELDEELAKCDVQCANCHRRATALEAGWYKFDSGELTA